MASRRHGVCFTASDIQDIDNILQEIEYRKNVEETISNSEHDLKKEAEPMFSHGDTEHGMENKHNEHPNTEIDGETSRELERESASIELSENMEDLQKIAELLFSRRDNENSIEKINSDHSNKDFVDEASHEFGQVSACIELNENVEDLKKVAERLFSMKIQIPAPSMVSTEEHKTMFRNAQVPVIPSPGPTATDPNLKDESTDQHLISEALRSISLLDIENLKLDMGDSTERKLEALLDIFRRRKNINNESKDNQGHQIQPTSQYQEDVSLANLTFGKYDKESNDDASDSQTDC